MQHFREYTLAGACRSNPISPEMPGLQKFSTLLQNYVKRSGSPGIQWHELYAMREIRITFCAREFDICQVYHNPQDNGSVKFQPGWLDRTLVVVCRHALVWLVSPE